MPLSHRPAVLLARSACERMPTGRVVEFRPYQRGTSARRQDLLRHVWGRLVWIAFAPVWRLVLAFVIGKRNQAGADLLLARVAHVTDDSIPLFTSDQMPAYRHALLNTYGEWYYPQRQGSRALIPTPAAATSQPAVRTGRQTARGRGAHGAREHDRVVFGIPEAVAARLAHSPVSSTVNTSFVERDNLTQRQSNRRLTRRTNGFSKDLTWFEKQLWLSLAYYHLGATHQSL